MKKLIKKNVIVLKNDKMFDLEALIKAEPNVFDDLCTKYPTDAALIMFDVVAAKKPVVKEPKDRYFYHAESDSCLVLHKGEEFPKDINYQEYDEISEESYKNGHFKFEETPAVKVEAAKPEEQAKGDIDLSTKNFPEDFQPLYKVGEKIEIVIENGKTVQDITIQNIRLSDDKKKYYYTYLIKQTGEVKEMAENFLVDHEVTDLPF